MLGLVLLLMVTTVVANNWKNLPLSETVRSLASEMDSSCVFLLHTPNKLNYDRARIIKVITDIATNFDVDVSITAISFRQLWNFFYFNRRYLDCKSPIMVVIHEDSQTWQQLREVSQRLPMHDFNWFVYGNVSMEWFHDILIPFSCFFINAQEVNKSYVELRELYRVTEDHPLRSPLYGYWTPHAYSIPTDAIYNRRNDLEGIKIRTGSTQNAPIHSFERGPTGELELVGYFPEVWKQLEELLNFTSDHYPSVDNVTGIMEKNGSWNGLIGMLLANQIDVAVSEFIMDMQRSHVVDFSRPLVKTSYQIFFKNVGAKYNWDAILRPFDNDIWLAILIWVVTGSCVLTWAHYQGCRHAFEKNTRPEDFGFFNSLFFHIKTLCSQGHNVIPSSVTCRIVYLSAHLVTCVLVPSYSAYLISYLTFRTPKRPFDDLQGLLDAKSYKLQTNSKTAEYTYFSEATDPTLQRIYRELMIKIPQEELPLNTQDALDRVCSDPHLAHFGDMAVAYSYLQYAKLHKQCDIVTLSRSISTIYSSMALRRHSPYRMAINHFLQRMEDHGLIDRTLDATFPTDKSFTYPNNNNVELNDVAQTFILLIIGICISFTMLLAEILYWRWRKRHRPLTRPKREGFHLEDINFVTANYPDFPWNN